MTEPDLTDRVVDARLQERARSAWHPVSEPPTESDADEAGNILVRTTEGVIETVEWDRECVHGNPIYEAPATAWARIRDVVLLPPA